jgi:uncharacterized protein YbaR (Trm112 family)
MLSKGLLDILVCPACKGDLEYKQDPERLVCPACRLVYPIRDEIPIMLVEEARSLDEENATAGGNDQDSPTA